MAGGAGDGGGEPVAAGAAGQRRPGGQHVVENYARVLRAWMEFLAGCGTVLFDSRERLRAALGAYAEYRARGRWRRGSR